VLAIAGVATSPALGFAGIVYGKRSEIAREKETRRREDERERRKSEREDARQLDAWRREDRDRYSERRLAVHQSLLKASKEVDSSLHYIQARGCTAEQQAVLVNAYESVKAAFNELDPFALPGSTEAARVLVNRIYRSTVEVARYRLALEKPAAEATPYIESFLAALGAVRDARDEYVVAVQQELGITKDSVYHRSEYEPTGSPFVIAGGSSNARRSACSAWSTRLEP
jgi:DNA-binding PucR family transcriptional regulator